MKFKKPPNLWWFLAIYTANFLLLVGGGGFEPPKTKSTDLQSVAFGRSANLPFKLNTEPQLLLHFGIFGAGGRNRTNNRLITSQMLYH